MNKQKIPPKSSLKLKTTLKHDIISLNHLSKVFMTCWIGGLWANALIIFPLLFRTLDQVSASNLIGQILEVFAYLGVVSLMINFSEIIFKYKLRTFKLRQFWYITCMLFALIINYFAIFPGIMRLKNKLSLLGHQVIVKPNSVFDFWHSLSALIFIIICVLGLLYIIDNT